MNPRDGIARKSCQDKHELDRLEEEKIEFHERVYEGFLNILEEDECGRIIRIDANRSEDEVFSDIKHVVNIILELNDEEGWRFYEDRLRFRT